VQSLVSLLERIRSHYASDPDLHRVALNAISWVEANLAVELLAESVPEKALVTVANLREALKELPRCPMPMPVDLESLSDIWDLDREGAAWVRRFEDEVDGHEILLLGDGNHCYDIVVRAGGRTVMWMPKDRDDDFVNPDVIDLVIARPSLLASVVDLHQAMGLPFNPMFYLSLEDWRQEYAQDIFEAVLEDFGLEGEARGRIKTERDDEPHGSRVRFRGVSDEGSISWLI